MTFHNDTYLAEVQKCNNGDTLGIHIMELAAKSPATSIEFLERLIGDNENFTRIIRYGKADISNFLLAIKAMEPELKNKITNIFISASINKDNFSRLFKVETDFTNISFQNALDDNLKICMFDALLLNNNFSTIFKNMTDIKNMEFEIRHCATVKSHPTQRISNSLSDILLDKFTDMVFRKESLQRLIKSENDIIELERIFPDRMLSHEEIVKNARMIEQSYWDTGTQFFKLPKDLRAIIAAMTKTDDKQSDADAHDIAHRNLNKPKPLKKIDSSQLGSAKLLFGNIEAVATATPYFCVLDNYW